MTKATFEAELLPHLADILMGGSHADEHLDGREVDAVVELLTGLIKDADELPEPLRNRIDAFDPEQFDIKRTAYAMGDLSKEQRRAVLEMLSDLSEVDDEIDLKEDEYLRAVADALGSSTEELEGLVVEIELISTPSRPVPPPLPPRSKP